MKHKILAFYSFVAIPEDQLVQIREALLQAGEDARLKGLILLAVEGINGTIAAPDETMAQFVAALESIEQFKGLEYKTSYAEFQPFRRWVIDVRDELITYDQRLVPGKAQNNHLSPSEWNRVLAEEDVLLIDTRNWYETKLGTFKGAIDPKIDTFTEFREFVRGSDLPKDKKVLMFCTGGIRCEKAILDMQDLGYQDVYQLEGGILNYLEQYPEREFEGECFVFDHRVSVDQKLQPSQTFKLCPHCGNPGSNRIECTKCGERAVICDECREHEDRHSCSKNCAYHLRRELAA